jgi:hypothetical protein
MTPERTAPPSLNEENRVDVVELTVAALPEAMKRSLFRSRVLPQSYRLIRGGVAYPLQLPDEAVRKP